MRQSYLILCMLLFLCGNIVARDLNIQDLIHETQHVEHSDNRFLLIWWIPTDYWTALFQKNSIWTETHKKEIQEALSHYIIISVADAKLDGESKLHYLSRKDILSRISIEMDENQTYLPLKGEEISESAKNILSELKPVLSETLGQFGEGFQFILFKDKNKKGTLLIDPRKKGTFRVNYSDLNIFWHLPLGSLLPPKKDTETGEEFPGNYAYNPYTGKPLP